jgi:peptidoglycan/LPS O-acetylase OafA/YrhL
MQVNDQKIVNNSRINGIDSLRGIAALVMALNHANGPFNLQLNVPNFRLDVFFILSGIIIALIYENKIYSNKIQYKDFLIKRISRLLPLHYITLFLTLLLFITYYIAGRKELIPAENNIFTFFLNLLLLQNIGLTNEFTWNYVSWSISAQILVESLWFSFISMKKNSTYLYLFIVIISMFILVKSFGLSFGGPPKYSIIYLNAGMLRYLMDFFIGLLIYRFFIRRFNFLSNLSAKFLNIISLLILLYLFTLWTYRPIYFEGADYVNAMFIYPVLICLCINSKTFLSNIINFYLFPLLGKISYSIFLIHPLIIVVMCKIQKHFDLNLLLLLFLYFVTLFIVAIFSYRYIELPGANIINNFFKKINSNKLDRI